MLSDRAFGGGDHRQTGWTEYEVRRMLRQMRRPHALEMHPLARILADVLDTPNCYDALRTTIDRAFSGAGALGTKLRELVYRSDIETSATRASVANQMHLSARQYFRYRKEAILLLVEYINSVVQRPAHQDDELLVRLAEKVRAQDPSRAAYIFESLAIAEPSAVEFSADAIESRIEAGELLPESALAGFPSAVADRLAARLTVSYAQRAKRDAAVALGDKLLRTYVERDEAMPRAMACELAKAVLIMSRHAHGRYDFELAARELRTLSHEEASLTFEAIVAEVESNLLSGRLGDAQTQLAIADRLAGGISARETAIVVLQHGAVMLHGGSYAQAITYAQAARHALQQFAYERSLADVIVMRARFAMGEPLQNIEAVGFPWRDSYLQALKARECLIMGDSDRAFAAATEAVAASEPLGFAGIRALGLATLAHLEYHQDRTKALAQLLIAWQLFLECGAATLTKDLLKGTVFQNHRLEETILTESFFTAYSKRLNEEFLSLPFFSTDKLAAAFTEILQACVRDALGLSNEETRTALERLQTAFSRRPNDRTAVARYRELFIERALLLLMPWIGEERVERFSATFSHRLSTQLHSLL